MTSQPPWGLRGDVAAAVGGCAVSSQHQPASQWLRACTRDEHRAAEAGLDLTRLRAPGDLAGLLRAWAAVWQEIRRAARGPGAAAPAGPELLVPATQSLAWLAADLADLDEQMSRDLLHDAPTAGRRGAPGCSGGVLTEPARVWGTAYVLRGSRLGGQFLAPAVAGALGLTGGRGTTFLASAGADTGAEWVAFRRRLDSVVLTADELADAGSAARRTFAWVGAQLTAGLARAPVAPLST